MEVKYTVDTIVGESGDTLSAQQYDEGGNFWVALNGAEYVEFRPEDVKEAQKFFAKLAALRK